MSLLDELVCAAHERTAQMVVPSNTTTAKPASFSAALLASPGLALIAEVKRKSPSKGAFESHLSLTERARIYEANGASAISVLTEPTRFGGCVDDLAEIARVTRLPILMKDFVVDMKQIHIARAVGASAVLLIVRALSAEQLAELIAVTHECGLEALVECHTAFETDQALKAGAQIIGVNNRNLDTFAIDRRNAPKLLSALPNGVVRVAESGYACAGDLEALPTEVDAILVGGALMTAADVGGLVRELAQ